MCTRSPEPASPWAILAPPGFVGGATLLLYLGALDAQSSPLHAMVPVQPGVARFTWLFALASLVPLGCLVWAWIGDRVGLAVLFALLAVPGVCLLMVCAYTTNQAATTCSVPTCADEQPYPAVGLISLFALSLGFIAFISTIIAAFAALDKLVHGTPQSLPH